MHWFIFIDTCRLIVPGKLSYCLTNLVNISLLVTPDIPFIWRGIMLIKWQLECSEVWTPKIKSTQGRVTYNMCGLFTDLLWPKLGGYTINFGAFQISYVVISLLYLRLTFALKSTRMKFRKGIFTITESRFNSKLLINDSKLYSHWLGERYNKIKLHSLSLIFILELMYSYK